MREPQYGRYILRENGSWETRYTAIDPAEQALKCTCKKPRCIVSRILPFREHIAELYRALNQCQIEGVFTRASLWDSVAYPLQLAASIEDVHADTSFVDDTMSVMMCRPAANYEAAHSEIASKYVAGSSIFSLIWSAYEGAVTATRSEEFRKLTKEGAFGKRGRSLVELYSTEEAEFLGVLNMARCADYHCETGGLFTTRLNGVRSRYPTKGLVFSAELVREFRNHLYHGEDKVPQHEDWSWGAQGETTARILRFYSVSRLALLLIQFMARLSVENADKIEFGYDSETDEPRLVSPISLFPTLHLRPENI